MNFKIEDLATVILETLPLGDDAGTTIAQLENTPEYDRVDHDTSKEIGEKLNLRDKLIEGLLKYTFYHHSLKGISDEVVNTKTTDLKLSLKQIRQHIRQIKAINQEICWLIDTAEHH